MNTHTCRFPFLFLSLLLALLISACTAIPTPASSRPALNPFAASSAARVLLDALRTRPGGTCSLNSDAGVSVNAGVAGDAPAQVPAQAGLPLQAVACTTSGTRHQVALTFSAEALPSTTGQEQADAQAQTATVTSRLAEMSGSVQSCSVSREADGALTLTLQTDQETARISALPGSTSAECWQSQASARITGASVVLYRGRTVIVTGEER